MTGVREKALDPNSFSMFRGARLVNNSAAIEGCRRGHQSLRIKFRLPTGNSLLKELTYQGVAVILRLQEQLGDIRIAVTFTETAVLPSLELARTEAG